MLQLQVRHLAWDREVSKSTANQMTYTIKKLTLDQLILLRKNFRVLKANSLDIFLHS